MPLRAGLALRWLADGRKAEAADQVRLCRAPRRASLADQPLPEARYALSCRHDRPHRGRLVVRTEPGPDKAGREGHGCPEAPRRHGAKAAEVAEAGLTGRLWRHA